jgi:thiamine kinase-like enzyme
MKNSITSFSQKNKILIPNIKEKIGEKLKELELTPEIPIEKFLKTYKTNKHRYFSPCKTKKGGVVGFYARLHNNLDAKQKFINEIKFLEILKKEKIKIKKFVPKILDARIETDFEWFIREHPKPLPLGHSRKAFSPISLNIIKKTTKIVFDITKIPPEKFSEIKLKKFDIKNYLAKESFKGLANRGIIPEEVSWQAIKMVEKTLPLLEKENSCFVHGDLNLGNILANQKEIWIIDWELIHLNNFAYDIGYLWAHLWEEKQSLRKKMMESYIANLSSSQFLKFKKLLPIVASYIALGGIEFKKRETKINRELRRNFYIKLLKSATKNFNALIKV